MTFISQTILVSAINAPRYLRVLMVRAGLILVAWLVRTVLMVNQVHKVSRESRGFKAKKATRVSQAWALRLKGVWPLLVTYLLRLPRAICISLTQRVTHGSGQTRLLHLKMLALLLARQVARAYQVSKVSLVRLALLALVQYLKMLATLQSSALTA